MVFLKTSSIWVDFWIAATYLKVVHNSASNMYKPSSLLPCYLVWVYIWKKLYNKERLEVRSERERERERESGFSGEDDNVWSCQHTPDAFFDIHVHASQLYVVGSAHTVPKNIYASFLWMSVCVCVRERERENAPAADRVCGRQNECVRKVGVWEAVWAHTHLTHSLYM